MTGKLKGDWFHLKAEVGKENPKKKLRIAFYEASGCGGCALSVLGMGEVFLELMESSEIVFWPLMKDKGSDIEDMPDKSIDVCFYSGNPRTEEQARNAKTLRKKAKILAALGACAHLGGIEGLANAKPREDIIKTKYMKADSIQSAGFRIPREVAETPEGVLRLPAVGDAKPLRALIDIDYVLPGCPPSPDAVSGFLKELINKKLPAKGSVIGAGKTICDECGKKKKNTRIKSLKTTYDKVDGKKCLLDQGILCMGPVTLGGCGASCTRSGMPCRGCYGPAEDVLDQGAAYCSTLSRILGREQVDEIRDYLGTVYRYSMPSSIMRGRKSG